MGRLTVVRHGQASFFQEDYDNLTDLGREQARELGAYWVRLGVLWDSAYMGPKRRHRQTLEAVADMYRQAGLPFPEPRYLPEFDEHQGPGVVKRLLADDGEACGTVNILPAKVKAGGKHAVNEYFLKFQQITRAWVRCELEAPGFESWQTFRGRIEQGLTKITTDCERGSSVVAFTSGGPVAAAVGRALNLDDERVLEMSWIVRNAALAEFRFSREEVSLISFNALPHFSRAEVHTFI